LPLRRHSGPQLVQHPRPDDLPIALVVASTLSPAAHAARGPWPEPAQVLWRPHPLITAETPGLAPVKAVVDINCGAELVVRGGVEPPTFRFSGGRSYQLSYLTKAATVFPDLDRREAGGRAERS
jgi:hypothetical protein